MNLSDFDYALPGELIAQSPLPRRDAARLMVLPAGGREVSGRRVADLPELLRPDDLLVVNDTRVFPARLRGRKASGGKIELLLIHRVEADGRNDGPGTAGVAESQRWRALLGSSRMPSPGSAFALGEGLTATVVGEPRDGEADIELRRVPSGGGPGGPNVINGSIDEAIDRAGETPLPPYIRREGAPGPADAEAYQTVYARERGAVAAPTAGLHFTRALLDRLAERGVERAALTLHVGLGTFQPVRAERVEDHHMHSEFFRIPDRTARAVNRARARGGRIVAVGTTVVRALEHAARTAPGPGGELAPSEGWCDLFITPGFDFRQTDLLLTNFHLPRSTLLMLVCAFAGRRRVLEAYARATREGYRFYSYGDAMLAAPGGPE